MATAVRGAKWARRPPDTRDRYLVKSVVHSSRLLSAFRTSGEALPLREISLRSGLPKSMTFRLLYTLERCGMVEKVGENLYRSCLRPVQAEALSAGLRGARHRLSVLEGSLRRTAARRAGRGHRAHLRRQPLQREDRAPERGRARPREGRSRHRVPDRRARRADRRGQVPRSQYPADRDRGAASRRDLLRREQLRSGTHRRAVSRPLGEAALARRGRRDRVHGARARREPAARCG